MATPTNLLKGRGCPNCMPNKVGNALRKTNSQFVLEMKTVNPYIKIIGNYNSAFAPIECECLIHKTIFSSAPTHLLTGQSGCLQCKGDKISNALKKKQEDFVNELLLINPNVEVIGQYDGADSNVHVKCSRCGNTWSPVANSLLNGFGCPRCATSKGEKRIRKYLMANHVEFDEQKKYSDLRGVGGRYRHLPLSYDFYLPKYNLLIEYQGQFHDHTTSLQTYEDYEIQKQHDHLKRLYAKEHKIDLLEIWYYDFNKIERILTDCINNLENPVTTTAV